MATLGVNSRIIPQSLKNGYHWGVALLAVLWYRYPARRLQVIGVTGTDGKTTTTSLIYHLLKTAGYRVAALTSVAAYLGSQSIDTGFHVTTPAPFPLERFLRRAVNSGCTHVVLEATSNGLDQSRLWGTNIQTAVITNVTRDHFDYHKTFARYLTAKAKILKHARLLIINADDPGARQLRGLVKSSRTRVITYSRRHATWLLTLAQTRFSQAYNQSNALAALTLAYTLKLPKVVLSQALKTFPGVPGRLQTINNQRGLKLIVDFAHTPNGLKSVLSALKPPQPHRLLVVFGAAGLRDAGKRPLMGEIAAALADEVILTAEDPRTEDVRTIIRQIKEGITTNFGHVHGIVDRRQAIAFALSLAQTGDTIAILGKGHEASMNLDGRHEIPWSDANVIKQLL